MLLMDLFDQSDQTVKYPFRFQSETTFIGGKFPNTFVETEQNLELEMQTITCHIAQ